MREKKNNCNTEEAEKRKPEDSEKGNRQ